MQSHSFQPFVENKPFQGLMPFVYAQGMKASCTKKPWARAMFERLFLLTLMGLMFVGCAQIPKESVELSTTVGKDISELQLAHINLANILFKRMKQDINSFVDDVYAPYLISEQLQAEELAYRNGQESLFGTLDNAAKHPDNAANQTEAVEYMEDIVLIVHEEIESFRKERLKPVLEQEKTALNNINQSYLRAHYANSIITGHLASVIKVHDAQEDVLDKVGLKELEGLREKVGSKLADTSDAVRDFVKKAKKASDSIQKTKSKMDELAGKLDSITSK